MRVAALLRRGRVPRDPGHRACHRLAIRILHRQAVLREDRDVTVFQKDHVPRVRENRGHVRRHERAVRALAYHERTARARGHKRPWSVLGHDGDRVAAADLVSRRADGRFQTGSGFQVPRDQMRHNFGVGLGLERVAVFLQLLLQRHVVLNDAVVHQRQRARPMGMGVLLRRLAVRRPAGMADPDGPAQPRAVQGFLQIRQLAHAAADVDLPVAKHGDTGRIIAPVLETLQPIQQHGHRLLTPDISDNAAHGSPSVYPWIGSGTSSFSPASS